MTTANEFLEAWKNGQVNGMSGEPSGHAQSQMIEEHPQLRIANALHATLTTAQIKPVGIHEKDGATSYNFEVNGKPVSFVTKDEVNFAIYPEDFAQATFGSQTISDARLNMLSSRALDDYAPARSALQAGELTVKFEMSR